jgi:hypothetical protein
VVDLTGVVSAAGDRRLSLDPKLVSLVVRIDGSEIRDVEVGGDLSLSLDKVVSVALDDSGGNPITVVWTLFAGMIQLTL